MTSTGDQIALGAATSGGTQTIEAKNDLLFTQLKTTGASGDAGSIDLTSTAGAVKGQGGSSLIASNADVAINGVSVLLDAVSANGAASIDAVTTLAGGTLTTGGDASLAAGVSGDLTPAIPVSLAWTTVNAGTTFEASAFGGPIATLGSVTSGGTQTLQATDAIGFTTLTSKGGDIDATSTDGSIGGGSATAKGSAVLAAYGDNTGDSVTAQTGLVSLTSQTGEIDWTNVKAARTFGATATAGGITLGSATSGGTQTLTAQDDLVYTNLTTKGRGTDLGDVNLQSLAGAVRGGTIHAHGLVSATGVGIDFNHIDAPAGLTLNSFADITGGGFTTSGAVSIHAVGAVEFGDVTGASITLATPGDMSFNSLTVATAMNLSADNLAIGLITQDPRSRGPLQLSITGYQGGIGTSAQLTIDAPNGLYVSQLREADAVIATNAFQIAMGDPTITNTLRLTTPDQVLLFDDASSQPVLGANVQFYQPSKDFYLTVDNRFIRTDSYIVQYDAGAQVQQDFGGALINGPSFVRDFDRLGRVGEEGFGSSVSGDNSTGPWYFPVEAFDLHLAAMNWRTVKQVGSGPAVNISGADAGSASGPAAFTVVFKRTRH